MKKILIGFLFTLIFVLNVNADEIYYKNNYGVEFSKEEYDFFSEMYYDGYQKYMSIEDFNYFANVEMNADLVESNYIIENGLNKNIMLIDESTTGTKKTLKISSKIGSNVTVVTVTANWFKNPTVRSYDVIGARFENTELLDYLNTKMINSSGETKFNSLDTKSNGFGQTFLLSGSNITITQTYTVKSGGTVYASYQHAKKVISAANSKKYTISSDGFGSVFKFTGKALTTYDQSDGVSILV